MDSDNKKVSGKFFSNLKPREVASFWFAISLTLLLPVTSLFTPHNQLLVGVGISVVLMFVIIWNGLSLAKSNAESSKSFERLRAALANLNDGVISYDHNFKILSINGAAQQIFGVNGQEVVGQYFGPEKAQDPKFRLLTQVIFPSLAPLVVKRSENDEYPQIVDISFNEPEVYFMVTTIKIGDIETQEFMKIIHDRTREIQLYQSKSEFITIAAHQLRTPLTAINWAFESMGKDYSPSPSEKETIKNGLIASTKALKIVNDLLDVSKIEEGRFGYNFENINIIDFIAGIMENANIAAKEYGVNLYFDRGGDPSTTLSVDASKLGLALSNLIDNAIKYNVKNGEVIVKIENLPGKPYVQISVEDTGIGIPPEAMDKVFTKFFRAANALKFRPEGSGLGVYIAKNIVTRHGGALWAESTLGRGTKFYMTLPTDTRLIPSKEVSYGEY